MPRIFWPRKFVGNRLVIGCLSLGPLLMSSCDGPSVVEGIPRNNSAQAVFEAAETAGERDAKLPEANNAFELSFLHADHFAVTVIELAKIIQLPELAEVPWNSLEQPLLPLVGGDNSSLKKIERMWILVDREDLTVMPTPEAVSPLIYVLDYFEPINGEQLNAALPTANVAAAAPPDSSIPKVKAIRLDAKRIAIGSTKQLEKLTASSGQPTPLTKKFSRMVVEADVNGALVIEPIQRFLQSLLGMAANFGDQGKQLADLPNLLQAVDWEISLTGDSLVVARIQVSNPDSAQKLARTLNEQLMGPSSSSPMLSQMMNRTTESMTVLATPASLQNFGNEIQTKGLLSVNSSENVVEIKLQRPASTNQLIAALVSDGREQALLAQRIGQLKQIGTAIKQFESQHGRLPASAAMFKNADGSPDQLSWRVAILPFLGEQELYDRFDFSQPWDSVENLAVAKTIPAVFVDLQPTNEAGNESRTRIHIAVTDQGLFRNDRPVPRLADITDKRIWTAVVIEGGPKSSSIWTDPTPLSGEALGADELGQPGESGVLMIDATFKPRIVKRSAENLSSIFSCDGNETMTRTDFIGF